MTDVPQGLPLLAAGGHDGPESGACLLELVSVLAGERFSDHPRCAHPVLAALGRAVNDTMSDARRPALALIAPDLIGSADAGWALDAVLVGLVAAEARLACPSNRSVRRALHHARRRARGLARGSHLRRLWLRTTRRRYRIHATEIVVQLVFDHLGSAGDEWLQSTLAAAVNECQRYTLAGQSRGMRAALSPPGWHVGTPGVGR